MDAQQTLKLNRNKYKKILPRKNVRENLFTEIKVKNLCGAAGYKEIFRQGNLLLAEKTVESKIFSEGK